MRRLGYLVLYGVAFVGLAACGGQTDTPPAEFATAGFGPEIGDHWHIAFEVSKCGSSFSLAGSRAADYEADIHRAHDSLIHIQPTTDETSGLHAVLGLFLDSTGVQVTDRGLESFDRTLPYVGECDGEPARMVLRRWPDGIRTAPVASIVASAAQLRSVPLDHDGAVIGLALVPDGQRVPFPEWPARDLDRAFEVQPTGPRTPILEEPGGDCFWIAPVEPTTTTTTGPDCGHTPPA